jgi:hypothetical protein
VCFPASQCWSVDCVYHVCDTSGVMVAGTNASDSSLLNHLNVIAVLNNVRVPN